MRIHLPSDPRWMSLQIEGEHLSRALLSQLSKGCELDGVGGGGDEGADVGETVGVCETATSIYDLFMILWLLALAFILLFLSLLRPIAGWESGS